MKKKKSARNPGDIIQLILKDHIPLKKLIEILKDPEEKISIKKPAFEKFAPSLLSHSKPEEESLYVHLKEESAELRAEGFEGTIEHTLAEQIIDEIGQTHDQDEWMAKVKVLAELVEHHIEEEEGEMFKKLKKEFNLDRRVEIGEEYRRLRNKFENEFTEDSRSKKQSNPTMERFL